jgi:hypothetical protein
MARRSSPYMASDRYHEEGRLDIVALSLGLEGCRYPKRRFILFAMGLHEKRPVGKGLWNEDNNCLGLRFLRHGLYLRVNNA